MLRLRNTENARVGKQFQIIHQILFIKSAFTEYPEKTQQLN